MFGIDHLVGLGFAWDSRRCSNWTDKCLLSPVASTKVVDPTVCLYGQREGQSVFFQAQCLWGGFFGRCSEPTGDIFRRHDETLRFSFRPGIRVSFDDFQDNLNSSKITRAMISLPTAIPCSSRVESILRPEFASVYKLREGRLNFAETLVQWISRTWVSVCEQRPGIGNWGPMALQL